MYAQKKIHSNDNIYYNVSIPHNDITAINGGPTPADYFEIRSQSLLDNPANEYTLSVVRMLIPTSEIPIQIFPIDISQPDINQSLYSVTLKWGAFEHTVKLIWIPQNTFSQVPPNILVAQDTRYSTYYYLYSVDHFAKLLNTALESAFKLLVIDGLTSTAPPFFEYDGASSRMSLYVPNSYIANDVLIYTNNRVAKNFGRSFEQEYEGYKLNDGKEVLYIVHNSGTNVVNITTPPFFNPPAPAWPAQDYIKLVQERNTIADMLSFTSLVLVTRSIPTRSEWVSTQSLKGVIPYGYPSPSEITNSDFFNILTDFEIDITTGGEIRNRIVYNPTAEYRRVTLRGTTKIDTVDVQIFWKDTYDNLYPLMIPSHDVASIKILFEKI